MKTRYSIIALIAFSSLFLSSCKESDEPNPEATITVTFSHLINNKTLDWDTIQYTNALNEDFSISTLKQFVSDITLFTTSGESVLLKDFQYIDARDGIGLRLEATVKAQKYSGISLAYGIPKDKNITNMFPTAPESNMEWPVHMGGGYHYMKFEGKFQYHPDTVKNYQLHTGPFKEVDYSHTFTFNTEIDLTSDKEVVIEQHLDKWMSTPNNLSLNDMSRIMGNADMQAKLQENTADVFTLGTIQ